MSTVGGRYKDPAHTNIGSYRVVKAPKGFKEYLDRIPVGLLYRDRKCLEEVKKVLLEKRGELMRIGGNTDGKMSHTYNQYLDGRISGMNLALSIIGEEIAVRKQRYS